MKISHYADVAIVLAWPETTARGEEGIIKFLKRVGIIRNTNLRVGHAALCLVSWDSEEVEYFDFGRYIAPRKHGRVRSKDTDPKLILPVVVRWTEDHRIANVEEIALALDAIPASTHGDGPMLFSMCYGIDYCASKKFANTLQEEGYQRYGGLSRSHTNCARFVSDCIMAGLPSHSSILYKLRWPLSYKPAPAHNVSAACTEDKCLFVDQGVVSYYVPSRWRAAWSLAVGILKSASPHFANKVRSDANLGMTEEPARPTTVPSYAHWLGGLGEGAWHGIEANTEGSLDMVRYAVNGTLEFEGKYQAPEGYLSGDDIELLFDSHHGWITVRYRRQLVRLRRIKL